MEDEIFKLICSNGGAVTTEDLLFNLYPGEAGVSQVIRNQKRFVVTSNSGVPKVLVRSRLRLCRHKDCPASCETLHLCKNYLLTGACRFSQLRRTCSFPHTLDTSYNAKILSEHGLENLCREELCTLLMQNDDYLLPPICYDYNNGFGEFGKCETGNACKRLHICEKYLKEDCSCPKTHKFTAPQPLKVLRDRGVPDMLFPTLKSAYFNKITLTSALKHFSGRGGAGTSQPNSSDGASCKKGEGFRGRGRGNRGRGGNRGNRGNSPHPNRATSIPDLFADDAFLNLSGTDNLTASIVLDSTGDNRPNQGSSTDKSNHNQASVQTGVRPNPLENSAFAWGGKASDQTNNQFPQQSSDTNESPDKNSGPKRPPKRRPVKDKTEICMFYIKGHCIHEERCFKAHDKMPYRWEINEGNQWTAMADNEMIEKSYCDPQNLYSSSSSPLVHFDTMTCGSNKVRRLSTINSLVEPTYMHTTEWLWYWQDENGQWNEYASNINGHNPADISSAALEQKFLDNDKDVEFVAGSQTYLLNFQDMMQTNKKYGTIRIVSRRPRFVSAEDVKKVRKPRPNLSAVPDHWDKSKISEAGFVRIPLQRSSEEYAKVEALFSNTMYGYDVQIERIQNKALWEKYTLQKNQMRSSNNGRNVTEKQLFHGTDPKHVDTICLNNLDWRICGVNGTAYGKGSYFARDAQYSHNYTGQTAVRTMFLSRVLVGSYCRGSSEYMRPPSKDGGDCNFYDSCVNDVHNPSIFVVFKEQQIYPEYLLKYSQVHTPVHLYTPAPAPPPAPRRVAQSTLPSYHYIQSSTAPRSNQSPAPAPAPRGVVQSMLSSYHQPSTAPRSNQSPAPSSKSDSCVIM